MGKESGVLLAIRAIQSGKYISGSKAITSAQEFRGTSRSGLAFSQVRPEMAPSGVRGQLYGVFTTIATRWVIRIESRNMPITKAEDVEFLPKG
ncbi:hypothetical protein BDV18DRAFT_134718 [Aspergillus unguis]